MKNYTYYYYIIRNTKGRALLKGLMPAPSILDVGRTITRKFQLEKIPPTKDYYYQWDTDPVKIDIYTKTGPETVVKNQVAWKNCEGKKLCQII